MKTILIVDPEFSGGSTADVLNRNGFAVLRASEAQTALTIIRSGLPVDLVITELQLPDIDGLDFLSSLKRGGSGLPVLVVTSCGSIESYLHAINLGVVEYLNKPVLTKDLSHIIRNVLDHQRRPSAVLDAA